MANRDLTFIVDSQSALDPDSLAVLVGFDGVDGVRLLHDIELQRGERGGVAILGPGRQRQMTVTSLDQLERLAKGVANPSGAISEATVMRALALSQIADRIGADAVVTAAHGAFGPKDAGLLPCPHLTDAEGALALLGSHVRQRDEVPLLGRPPLVQVRSEVYSLTARVCVPIGQDWWGSVVGMGTEPVMRLGQAVFIRIGQTIRGRDAVHETLRLGEGRSAIVDSLYHLDVVLMSLVGALDGLARVAHVVFGVNGKSFGAGWQKGWSTNSWLYRLSEAAPSVADVVADGSRRESVVRLVARTRNTIHAVPPEEYLAADGLVRVEHRAMLPEDVADELRHAAANHIALPETGLHLDGPGVPFLNIGQFTEWTLGEVVDVIDNLMAAMLSTSAFPSPVSVQFSDIERAERAACLRLAGVGIYPW